MGKYTTTFEKNLRNQRRREKYKEYTRKWATDKIQQGLCRACGGEKENKEIQHCEKCKRKRTSARLKSLYGITIDEYEELSAHQNHICWICGGVETTKDGFLHVDHDHNTGQIRGLLCAKCNQGIGCFKENIEALEKAIEYLRINSCDTTN